MYEVAMDATLELLLQDAGLDALAAQGITALSVPYAFYDLEEATVRERAAALQSRNLRVVTCHLPYGANNNRFSPCAEEDAVFSETIGTWRRYLHRFAWTGMHSTPMHTGGCMHPAVPPRLRDRLTQALEAIVPVARESGVIVALENTFYPNPPAFSGMGTEPVAPYRHLNDDCAMLADYVKGWNDPAVRICLDVGHTNIFGHTVMPDLKVAAPHAALLHLHDNDETSDQHVAPGLGTIPWQAVARHLQTIGYRDAIYAEIHKDPDPQNARAIHTPEVLVLNLRRTLAALTVTD